MKETYTDESETVSIRYTYDGKRNELLLEQNKKNHEVQSIKMNDEDGEYLFKIENGVIFAYFIRDGKHTLLDDSILIHMLENELLNLRTIHAEVCAYITQSFIQRESFDQKNLDQELRIGKKVC